MRILIVEDDQELANILQRGLTGLTYAVDTANDGEEGEDMAKAVSYDLIILDIILPKKDGIEVCLELRRCRINSRIIMLTSRDTVSDRVKGLNSGADDYLVKPFAFDELVARIRALSRRPKLTHGEKLSVKDLELNTNTYEVRKGGKEIKLSRKEFSLLEYLMRNKGKVVSKDQIISHIWDYDADILPNTVEVFIKYLRGKIGKDAIKTVRGFGYKINV